MSTSSEDASSTLAPLAQYLAARREAILNQWRVLCESDPSLETTPRLSRQEFNNKTPFMLNVLEQHLQRLPKKANIKHLAAQHGLHRWQKGYALHELLEEMKYLHQVLLGELRQYLELGLDSSMMMMATAYEQLSWFSGQTIDGSVEQYSDLQLIAARSRAESLEKALAQLNELVQERGDLLRTASHDLRGSFGIIQGATTLLKQAGDSAEERQQMLAMLERNLTTVRELLTQLMDLARLEARVETVAIQTFDASALLYGLAQSLQPLALQQGLVLRADGTPQLLVECDPVQLQRIVQNLLLNALKHTPSAAGKPGLVSLSWSQDNDHRWFMSVQDSGPGLPSQQAGPLTQALIPPPGTTSGMGLDLPPTTAGQERAMRAPSLFESKGEGIGLSIVKRLCELLHASLEIESEAGKGTLFRIGMSIHWPG